MARGGPAGRRAFSCLFFRQPFRATSRAPLPFTKTAMESVLLAASLMAAASTSAPANEPVTAAALDQRCFRLMADLAEDEDPRIRSLGRVAAQYFLGRIDAAAAGLRPGRGARGGSAGRRRARAAARPLRRRDAGRRPRLPLDRPGARAARAAHRLIPFPKYKERASTSSARTVQLAGLILLRSG